MVGGWRVETRSGSIPRDRLGHDEVLDEVYEEEQTSPATTPKTPKQRR